MYFINNIITFFKDKDKPRTLVILVLLVFSLMLIIENINGRFWLNDFRVMYTAAEAFLSGEQVYAKPFGLNTGFFKYSPESTVLFMPYLLVKFKAAAVLHYCLILVCTVGLFLNVYKLVTGYLFTNLNLKKPSLLLLPTFVFSLVHLVREFHLGNVNIILVFLISWTILASLNKKLITAGIVISLVIFIKPYFIILLLAFFLVKQIKPIVVSAIFSIGCILLFSLIVGFENSISLHYDWLKSMLDHSSYLASNHTVFALANRHFGLHIPYANSPVYLFAIGFILFLFFLLKKTKKSKLSYVFFTLIYLAIIPNMIITDVEHFLFAIPLIVIITAFIIQKNKYYLYLPFFITLILYGGKSNDLLGKALATIFHQNGFLGIANLVFIVTSLLLFNWLTKKNWITN